MTTFYIGQPPGDWLAQLNALAAAVAITATPVYAGLTVTGTTYLGGAAGAESLRVTPVASSANYWRAYGAATASGIGLSLEGGDANVTGYYQVKGAGAHVFQTGSGNNQLKVAHTANAVNYAQITGAAAGSGVAYTVAGSDANIGTGLISKGVGDITFSTGGAGGSVSFYTDTYGALQFQVTRTASAVNRAQVTGSATGNLVYASTAGSDSAVGFGFSAKGAATYSFQTNGNNQVRITDTASAVNYNQLTGGATGIGTELRATGSDADVYLYHTTKGAGAHDFYTALSTRQFRVAHVASAVNYWNFYGNATGNEIGVNAAGSDTNINKGFQSKGTGVIRFATGGGTQFRVADTASAVNYAQITGGDGTITSPNLTLQGASSNVTGQFMSKGTGIWQFHTNGGYEQFRVAHTASAVNYTQVTGGATTVGSSLTTQGSDANAELILGSKGAYGTRFLTNTATQLIVANTNSAVNYPQLTGSATGSRPLVSMQGSDANPGVNISAKGTGDWLATGGNASYTLFRAGNVASAVNYPQFDPATTGNGVTLSAQGSDSNVLINVTSKGGSDANLSTQGVSGWVVLKPNNVATFAAKAVVSQVNYMDVTGSATGSGVALSTQGSDTNITNISRCKGNGGWLFRDASDVSQFGVDQVTSAVNRLFAAPSATGNAVRLYASGSDATIDLSLEPKSGYVKFGTWTSSADAPINGYVILKTSDGITRKMATLA